jgi:hypothetical protein
MMLPAALWSVWTCSFPQSASSVRRGYVSGRDERNVIAFCVRVGKNGVKEMVRKLECPVHQEVRGDERKYME